MSDLRSGKSRHPRYRGPVRKPASSETGGFGQWLTDAMAEVLSLDMPADLALRRFFRQNKAIGRRDRGLIADRCFDALRQRRWYGHLAESGQGFLPRRMALLADANASRQVLSVNEEESLWLKHIDLIDRLSLALPLRTSMPDWLVAQLEPVLGEAHLDALGEALLKPADMDLRANLAKTKATALAKQLATQEIIAIPLSPEKTWAPESALRVSGHPALENSAAFAAGEFEVQDVGSQLVAAIAAPRRGDTVVDFCAGAGGKTLALAAQMRSRGQIFACDTAPKRLARLTPRLARSGATNVQPMRIDTEHDKKLSRLRRRAHVVLVDAPCSGTGTLRRNPDLKWRHDLSDVRRLTGQQASILKAASGLVRTGGKLVYATCSLLELENEEIARAFEKENPEFERIDLPAQFMVSGKENATLRPDISPENAGFLRLWPHLDDSDGFFVAAWTLRRSDEK